MRKSWRAIVLAMALAVPLQGCAGSSDVTAPPTGTNPPPEQPNPPNPPPPPPPPPPPEPTEPPPAPPPGPPIPNPPGLGAGARVLFIGNSLTQGNDLPGMVRRMAAEAGLNWFVDEQLLSGAGLEDHWQRGFAQAKIRSGPWDAVVLQQGPSSLQDSRANLRQWAAEFDGLVRESGGRSALYMVWPDLTRIEWFDRVRDSYALAARDVDGWFLPAGETLRAAWQVQPNLALLGGDVFHPTLAGTYAAALTIFAGLSDRSPLDVGTQPGVNTQMAASLRNAAKAALDKYSDYGPTDSP
jgi:hypothetical protein